VAGADWSAVAGPAGAVRALADGVRALPALATRWEWADILMKLQARADAVGDVVWEVNVDSVCRAHQHAAGARREPDRQQESSDGPSLAEPADHGLGRSRGGLTTKLHLACEQGQKPLSFLLTAGQRGDAPQFVPVLEAIRGAAPGSGTAAHPPRPGAR
jgi:hypothetical protein